MSTNTKTLAVVVILLSLFCYTPVKAGSRQADTDLAKKAKATITKVGTGFESRVDVKLLDKTRLRGYVSETRDDYFIVVVDGTNKPAQVLYSEVQKVKRLSHGESTDRKDKIMKVAGIGLLIYFVVSTAVGYANY